VSLLKEVVAAAISSAIIATTTTTTSDRKTNATATTNITSGDRGGHCGWWWWWTRSLGKECSNDNSCNPIIIIHLLFSLLFWCNFDNVTADTMYVSSLEAVVVVSV